MDGIAEIDKALVEQEIKRAEVLIAKAMRSGAKTSKHRAILLWRRAKARLMDGRPDDALEDLETSLQLDDTTAPLVEQETLRGDIAFTRFELATLGFAERSDTDTALGHYQAALDASEAIEERGWIHYQIGRIYLSQQAIEKAKTHFQLALKSTSASRLHTLIHERIGFIALFEDRDPAVALEHFQTALTAAPQTAAPGWLVQVRIRMSRAYLEIGQYEDALKAARLALREVQNGITFEHRNALPDAHLALAEVMFAIPSYETDAIEHYLRFMQTSRRPSGIDVTWSKVHENIGHLSMKLEQYQQAIDAYERSIELDPYHPWETNIYLQVARCYYRLRNYERTVQVIRGMLAKADQEGESIQDWLVFNVLGNAYFALEKYSEAAEAYQQAITIAPLGTDLRRTEAYLRTAHELSQKS